MPRFVVCVCMCRSQRLHIESKTERSNHVLLLHIYHVHRPAKVAFSTSTWPLCRWWAWMVRTSPAATGRAAVNATCRRSGHRRGRDPRERVASRRGPLQGRCVAGSGWRGSAQHGAHAVYTKRRARIHTLTANLVPSLGGSPACRQRKSPLVGATSS